MRRRKKTTKSRSSGEEEIEGGGTLKTSWKKLRKKIFLQATKQTLSVEQKKRVVVPL